MQVKVPATSLCPCSKEIAAYGAHNQRSHITIDAELAESVTMDELLALAERSAPCEVYGLLKRADEKYVAERAYDNPCGKRRKSSRRNIFCAPAFSGRCAPYH